MKWYIKWIIYELRIWNQVKLWSSQLWTQFLQLRKEAWNFQNFNGVWTRDLAIPVRRWAMNPLTLGAGHLWVLMLPWGMNQRWNDIWNGSYMNCGYKIKWSYDPRSYERNFCNCVKNPEKFRTSTGFEPVTSRYRCDALTNWAMKPLTLGAGHLWIPMFPWGERELHLWIPMFPHRYMYCEVTGSNPVEVLNFSGEDHSFTWL